MTIPSESGLEMKLTGLLFQKAWREAFQKVRSQDPRLMEIHALHIDIPNTSERVAPASERSGDVEQQAKEENL